MPHGPVNSLTYGHINGDYDLDACGWSDFLEDREHHNIALARPGISGDDLDELSDADLHCADAVWDRFGDMTAWQLRDWTHDPRNIPEWEDPNGGSTIIPLQRILHAVGVANAEEFAEAAATLAHIDKAFHRAMVN